MSLNITTKLADPLATMQQQLTKAVHALVDDSGDHAAHLKLAHEASLQLNDAGHARSTLIGPAARAYGGFQTRFDSLVDLSRAVSVLGDIHPMAGPEAALARAVPRG